MSLVARARRNFERGDTLRAVLTLVAGIRRSRQLNPEEIDFLTTLVADELTSTGIEHELAAVLIKIPSAPHYLGPMVVGLRARGEDRIADLLISECGKRGLHFAPQEPEPEPEPESEPETEQPEPEQEEPGSEPVEDPSVVPDEPSPGATPHADDVLDEEEKVDSLRKVADKNLSTRRERAATKARERRAKIRRRLTIWAVLIGTAVGGVIITRYVIQASARSVALNSIDLELQSFAVEESRDRVVELAANYDAPEFTERAAFARALAAEPSKARLDGWHTDYGLASSSLAAAHSGDLEGSLASLTKLERQHPRSALVHVARAVLSEKRGQPIEATTAARAVLDRHPGFVPAHEIIVRAALRSEDRSAAKAAGSELGRWTVDHPYISLHEAYPDSRELLISQPREVGEAELDAKHDSFVAAVVEFRLAVRAGRGNDQAEMIKRSRAALKHDPNLTGARVLLAAALGADGDAEQASKEFAAASDRAHGAAALLIQVVAPASLSAAGDPRAGARFTTVYPRLRGVGVGNKLEDVVGDARPQVLRQPALAAIGATPWAAEALFSRVDVLAGMGEHATAAAMLRDMAARGIEPARASGEAALLESRSDDDSPVAMRSRGGYARFLEATSAVAKMSPRIQEARIDVMLRLERLEDAEAAIGGYPGFTRRPIVDALSMRLAARRQQTAEADAGYERLSSRRSDVRAKVALARRAALRGKTTDAWKLISEARRKDPHDASASETCVMIAKLRAEDDAALACGASFAAFAEQPDLMVELGLMQLHAGQKKSARATLESAAAASPSVDAARALGTCLGAIGGTSLQAELAAASSDYEKREDWKGAIALYTGALARRASQPGLHVAIGKLLERAGDRPGARVHGARYLQLRPNGRDADWARALTEAE